MSQLLLPLTQPEFDTNAEAFLSKHGFPLTSGFRIFYGAAIQQAINKNEELTEEGIVAFVRSRQLNELAYNFIKNAVKERQEEQRGPEGSEGTAKVLELTPQG